jgi:hypothetical protein
VVTRAIGQAHGSERQSEIETNNIHSIKQSIERQKERKTMPPAVSEPTAAEREAELMALQAAFDEYIASSRELEEELDAELAKVRTNKQRKTPFFQHTHCCVFCLSVYTQLQPEQMRKYRCRK